MSTRSASRSLQDRGYRKHVRDHDGAADDNTIRVYIADLEAYNDGRLKGEWVELPMDEDELAAVIDRHSRNREQDWAIHDYEAPFHIEEYESPEELNRFMHEIFDQDANLCVVAEALDYGYDKKGAIEAAADSFVVHADNNHRDLGYALVDDVFGGVSELGERAEMYFDYDSFGRDFRMDEEANLDPDDPEEADILDHYETMDDQELAENFIDDMGGVGALGAETIERYFDYESYGRDAAFEMHFVNCDGEGMWVQFT